MEIWKQYQLLFIHILIWCAQYGNIKQVQFISATNKLKCKKATNIKTDTYKDRKKASIDLIKLLKIISKLFNMV
jgi:uncharacterized membrane protein